MGLLGWSSVNIDLLITLKFIFLKNPWAISQCDHQLRWGSFCPCMSPVKMGVLKKKTEKGPILSAEK